jgi:hypothetical protein
MNDEANADFAISIVITVIAAKTAHAAARTLRARFTRSPPRSSRRLTPGQ